MVNHIEVDKKIRKLERVLCWEWIAGQSAGRLDDTGGGFGISYDVDDDNDDDDSSSSTTSTSSNSTSSTCSDDSSSGGVKTYNIEGYQIKAKSYDEAVDIYCHSLSAAIKKGIAKPTSTSTSSTSTSSTSSSSGHLITTTFDGYKVKVTPEQYAKIEGELSRGININKALKDVGVKPLNEPKQTTIKIDTGLKNGVPVSSTITKDGRTFTIQYTLPEQYAKNPSIIQKISNELFREVSAEPITNPNLHYKVENPNAFMQFVETVVNTPTQKPQNIETIKFPKNSIMSELLGTTTAKVNVEDYQKWLKTEFDKEPSTSINPKTEELLDLNLQSVNPNVKLKSIPKTYSDVNEYFEDYFKKQSIKDLEEAVKGDQILNPYPITNYVGQTVYNKVVHTLGDNPTGRFVGGFVSTLATIPTLLTTDAIAVGEAAQKLPIEPQNVLKDVADFGVSFALDKPVAKNFMSELGAGTRDLLTKDVKLTGHWIYDPITYTPILPKTNDKYLNNAIQQFGVGIRSSLEISPVGVVIGGIDTLLGLGSGVMKGDERELGGAAAGLMLFGLGAHTIGGVKDAFKPVVDKINSKIPDSLKQPVVTKVEAVKTKINNIINSVPKVKLMKLNDRNYLAILNIKNNKDNLLHYEAKLYRLELSKNPVQLVHHYEVFDYTATDDKGNVLKSHYFKDYLNNYELSHREVEGDNYKGEVTTLTLMGEDLDEHFVHTKELSLLPTKLYKNRILRYDDKLFQLPDKVSIFEYTESNFRMLAPKEKYHQPHSYGKIEGEVLEYTFGMNDFFENSNKIQYEIVPTLKKMDFVTYFKVPTNTFKFETYLPTVDGIKYEYVDDYAINPLTPTKILAAKKLPKSDVIYTKSKTVEYSNYYAKTTYQFENLKDNSYLIYSEGNDGSQYYAAGKTDKMKRLGFDYLEVPAPNFMIAKKTTPKDKILVPDEVDEIFSYKPKEQLEFSTYKIGHKKIEDVKTPYFEIIFKWNRPTVEFDGATTEHFVFENYKHKKIPSTSIKFYAKYADGLFKGKEQKEIYINPNNAVETFYVTNKAIEPPEYEKPKQPKIIEFREVKEKKEKEGKEKRDFGGIVEEVTIEDYGTTISKPKSHTKTVEQTEVEIVPIKVPKVEVVKTDMDIIHNYVSKTNEVKEKYLDKLEEVIKHRSKKETKATQKEAQKEATKELDKKEVVKGVRVRDLSKEITTIKTKAINDICNIFKSDRKLLEIAKIKPISKPKFNPIDVGKNYAVKSAVDVDIKLDYFKDKYRERQPIKPEVETFEDLELPKRIMRRPMAEGGLGRPFRVKSFKITKKTAKKFNIIDITGLLGSSKKSKSKTKNSKSFIL